MKVKILRNGKEMHLKMLNFFREKNSMNYRIILEQKRLLNLFYLFIHYEKKKLQICADSASMDNENQGNEVERELRGELEKSKRQILIEREYYELCLEERQLALVLSSTDIQRILDLTTEEQQMHIESEKVFPFFFKFFFFIKINKFYL